MKRYLVVVSALFVAAVVLWSQRERLWPTTAKVGPAAKGGYLLNSGWTVRPAGKQVALNTLPLAARLVDNANAMLILQSGYKTPSLSLHRAATGERIASIDFKDAFHGLTVFGDLAYVGGGTTMQVHEVRFAGGSLKLERSFSAVASAHSVGNFTGDVVVSADGATLYAADLIANSIAVIDRRSGKLERTIATGRMPYRLLLHPKRKELLATSWSDGEVIRHDLVSGNILQRIASGSHSSDMLWQTSRRGLRLLVAAAHTNHVSVFQEGQGGELNPAESINIAMSPQQPLGMTPSALSLSADGKLLYIACSDANVVAVVDVADARSRVMGFIPAGWYPTATLPLPQGRLAILNGKGVRSFANPAEPRKAEEQKQKFQHAGNLQMGGLSLVDAIDAEQLKKYTQQAYENSPYRDHLLQDAGVPAGNPVPSSIGKPSPIKHVIYIVKENRTYDQVFGDLPRGNGDPSLLLFDAASSINHRKLAEEFVLFDNFYVNSDVSADGHNWSAGAISPDMTNKLWPNLYSGRNARFSLYWGRPPVNHTEDAARPHGGYLWTRAFEAGVTVRNYGWLTKIRREAKTGEDQVVDAESKELLAATNRLFRPYDLSYPDVDRMTFFLQDLAEFERKGEMPGLIVMRLGNDHTSGLTPGGLSPRAMFADNDLALGRLVEGVSRSRFWKDTAIFVLEDDAQSGPDHVDSHRSVALVISPYVKRKHLDSNFYNTASMLRTMELILGLKPMTHFDAAAMPMHTAFTATPDLTPYKAETPRQSLSERNPARGALAERSKKLDFSEADRIDDQEMNDILYRAIQGRPAPPPVRSLFEPGSGEEEEEEEKER